MKLRPRHPFSSSSPVERRTMHVSLLAVLLAMVVMVTGHAPTEEQLKKAVASATKELGNGHCVRKDNNVVCEKESKQTMPVSATQRHFAAMHRSTPGTIKLSQSAAILEKVAKNLMNRQFTLEQLGRVESPIITDLCLHDDSCKQKKINGIEFRTANGCLNNLKNPMWGTPEECMRRLLEPQYGTDASAPRTTGQDDTPLPNARKVSLVMHEDLRKSNKETSHMLMQFGQFVAHEITGTVTSESEGFTCKCDSSDEECFNIPVPPNDPDFLGSSCIEFVRSSACPNDSCSMGIRQQFHKVTAFIDASNVYGQNENDMNTLRNGFLLNSRPNPDDCAKKELLPPTVTDVHCAGFTEDHDDHKMCSQAGDTRVNQQPALTSLHTVFMREHNRIAKRLHKLNPQWDDHRVFFEARKIVGALLQKIAYGEYLPLVLGPVYMMTHHDLTLTQDGFFYGYDQTVNPGIYNAFSTAAYRFGHSMVQNEFDRYSTDSKGEQCPIKLASSFFNPRYILNNDQGGPDSILRGLTAQPRQDFDRFMVSGLTKFLFAKYPGSDPGLDLAAINIQRGRDHGLPGYNAWRLQCGFQQAQTFNDLAPMIPDETTREKLQNLYSHVDDIDLFVGGLAEESVPGGIVGPTFARLIGMQFQNLRKGDRFWFEHPKQFTEDQLAEIKKHSLARILCDNTDGTTQMQPDVFRLPTQPGNERKSCTCLTQMDLTKWQL